jgi:uncharacterized integral membrane protein
MSRPRLIYPYWLGVRHCFKTKVEKALFKNNFDGAGAGFWTLNLGSITFKLFFCFLDLNKRALFLNERNT